MLVALAGGVALPAGELAETAGVTSQSASGHLRKLVEGGVVSVWPQGRFRYFRLADEEIATVLEALAGVACSRPRQTVSARLRPPHLLAARCCYNHMAGRLGVAFADALVNRDYVRICKDAVALTSTGSQWLGAIGLPVAKERAGSAQNLRLCLDWTERRFHLAGPIPTAILRFLLDAGHLGRAEERSLTVTPTGKAWFGQLGVKTICGDAQRHPRWGKALS
jgi:DNA-binding transcriptional ArsR family regulator